MKQQPDISDEQIAAYEARARRNGERRTAQLCEQVLRERHDRARGLAEGVSRDEHELTQEITAAEFCA